ncbi:MAG TPA: hypothetical protein VEI07_24530 [Planctomycetaceae bacterium]|nr:hypothetical protein [Planctomycetaceae bacterium]
MDAPSVQGNMPHPGSGALKFVLVFVWASWLTVVLTTNSLDGLKALGLLPENWAFASGNYRFLVATTARYGATTWINAILFSGVIAWDATAAILFWRAACLFPSRSRRGTSPMRLAFAVSLSLWGSFLVADEVCVAYEVEGKHLLLFIAELVTLLAIELLPE